MPSDTKIVQMAFDFAGELYDNRSLEMYNMKVEAFLAGAQFVRRKVDKTAEETDSLQVVLWTVNDLFTSQGDDKK